MQELTAYRNWVVTYLHNKIPLNPFTGAKADVSDSATWGDYATAASCVNYNPMLTLGFVLTNTPFACVDLDTHKTNDPLIIENHKKIFDYFNTFSELSPNGGVHIWCKGDMSNGGKRLPSQFIEVYKSSRYMTITNKVLKYGPIEERQNELTQLYTSIEQQINSVKNYIYDSGPEKQSDQEVCLAAASAINGQLFHELYVGNWQGTYPSQSEADQALMNIIAYYTDNKEQCARIFHSSVLGRRQKAHRQDYLYHLKYGLVTKAFDQKLPFVTLKNLENIVKNKVIDERLKAIEVPINGYTSKPTQLVKKIERLPEFIRNDFGLDFREFPPGRVGEVARFIYENSVRPMPEIAISGALALFAGICGKAFNISATGLNLYIAVLAPTGSGKEAATSGIERLAMYIREKGVHIDSFLGPSDIASPQALIRHLQTNPCFVTHKGEMGFWMNKICSRFARGNETGLRGLLLDLFTKSGKHQVMRGSIYSDRAKNVEPIQAPAFSLFGDATPDRFYQALDEENVEEGLVSRFTVVEIEPEEVEFNKKHDTLIPNPLLVDSMGAIVRLCLNMQSKRDDDKLPTLVRNIEETPEAFQEQTKFQEECYKRTIAGEDSNEAKLYSRAHLRLLRIAGLIAVGVNPDCPVLTPEIVDWTRRFVVHGIGKVSLRFDAGEVGEVNLFVQQRKKIVNIIKRYWQDGFHETLVRYDNINQPMYDARIVTMRYIQRRISGYSCFRKSKNVGNDCHNIIHGLIEDGILTKIDMGMVRDSPRKGIAYIIHDMDALLHDGAKGTKLIEGQVN